MTGFVVAMDCEANCVLAHLARPVAAHRYGRRVVDGECFGAPVRLVVSGIGKSNAAAATQFLLQSGAETVVNLGVAGGFDPAMRVGDVWAVSQAVQYDFDLADLNGLGVGTLDEYDTPFIPLAACEAPPALAALPRTVCATGDRFADGDADVPLLRRLGCGLRDMECAAVAHVCHRAGVRCLAFKAVTDVFGLGSMTDQYAVHLPLGLSALTVLVGRVLGAGF